MKVLTIITTYFMADASQEDTKNHLLEQRKSRSCLLLGNSKYELLPRICVSGYQTRLVRTQARRNLLSEMQHTDTNLEKRVMIREKPIKS